MTDPKEHSEQTDLVSSADDHLVSRSADLVRRGLALLGPPTLLLSAIEPLAFAIEATTGTKPYQVRRLRVQAVHLARAMGLSEEETYALELAALLHDIGKLAVPGHIWSKPGPLTQEEFQKIRSHPQVGAEIVSAASFPDSVASVILNHHERWDGRGYPAGRKGDDIPLSARIFAVIDYFEALMTDRPYHKAMSFEEALELLQQEAGKGLDPVIVSTFIEKLPKLTAELAQLEQRSCCAAVPPPGVRLALRRQSCCCWSQPSALAPSKSARPIRA